MLVELDAQSGAKDPTSDPTSADKALESNIRTNAAIATPTPQKTPSIVLILNIVFAVWFMCTAPSIIDEWLRSSLRPFLISYFGCF